MNDQSKPEEPDEDFLNAVLGAPPKAFKETILHAAEINRILDELKVDERGDIVDALIVCAVAYYRASSGDEQAPHAAGFVGRCRQINKWINSNQKTKDYERADFSPLSRKMLENKSLEIARRITKMMFNTENFILLLMQKGTEKQKGFVAHVSSTDVHTQIDVLEQHVHYLKTQRQTQA